MTRLKVLLLAGSSADARLITEVLRAARATPIDLVAAASTQIAVNHLANRRFDAVLVDPQQTDRPLADAIQAIRAHDQVLPIVILAGEGERLRLETSASNGPEYVYESAGDGQQLVQALVHAVERAGLQQALRASERRYRELIERAPVAIFRGDLDGGITAANSAWLDLHGYEHWPVPEPSWLETFATASQGRELLRRVIEDGQIHDVEAVILRRDRKQRVVLISARTVQPSIDGPPCIEGTLLDISDRRRAERRVVGVLRGVPDPLLVVSSSGAIVFANTQASSLFGYTGAELRGQPIEMLVPEDVRAVHELHVKRYFASARACPMGSMLDLSARKKDGSIFPVEISLSPLDDSAARLALCIVRDASHRRKLEGQLRQARKAQAVGRLAGEGVQAIDAMLTAILDDLRMLEDSCRGQPALEQRVRSALDSVSRGAMVVCILQEFARSRPSTPEDVDVNDLVTGLEPMFQCILDGRTKIRTELTSDPCIAYVDATRLKLAVLSLALFSRAATTDVVDLVVATASTRIGEDDDADVPAGEYVVLRIDPASAPRDMAADPAARRSATREHSADSLMEPSMAHALVRQSGGYARFRSPTGSVEIYLPRASSEGNGDDTQPTLRRIVPSTSRRVLLVDNESSVREVASSMLQSMGYSVVAAASGTRALELLAGDGEFALLLTDLMPGGTTGVELVQRARERRPGLGAVYTTTFPDTVILNRRAISDRDPILGKPFTLDELAQAVRLAVD